MELKILHDNSNYYLNFQNNISYIIFDNYKWFGRYHIFKVFNWTW